MWIGRTVRRFWRPVYYRTSDLLHGRWGHAKAIAFIAAYLILIAASYYLGTIYARAISASSTDLVGATAVVLTGVAVIWYTWETKQLRAVTHKQVQLQLQPFVMLFLKRMDKQGWALFARNIGHGPAIGVRFYYEPVLGHNQNVQAWTERATRIIPVIVPGDCLPVSDSFWGDVIIRVAFQDIALQYYMVTHQSFGQTIQGAVTVQSTDGPTHLYLPKPRFVQVTVQQQPQQGNVQ